MDRLSRLDLAFVVGTTAAWAGLALLSDRPWIDRFFLAVMLTCLLYLLRLGAQAWANARRERRRAVTVRRLQPDEVARAAVAEERARLSADIARCLRDSLAAVRAETQQAATAADPVPHLLRVQDLTRGATTELRRQLGLLRAEQVAVASSTSVERDRHRLSRRDLLVGAGVTMLALVEVTAYVLTEGFGDGSVLAMPGSVVSSALAAAAITWRRTAPVVAALWCGAVFAAGTLLAAPVGGGFWAVATVGALAWTLAASAPARPSTLLVWAGFVGLMLHSRVVDDPDNTRIFALLVAVATGLGLVVRFGRARGHRAAASARAHQESLEESARTAVSRERQQFAREIHDVVSHAVGLIAMQAGAAEMSWPHDAGTTRRAVEVIGSTASATLAEIDRLLPGAETGEVPRLDDLVARIRAAGTPVRLEQRGDPGADLAPLVYRIVQEGLTNAVRHAPGAAVTVQVTSRPETCEVLVTDDGRGPDEHHHPGYGLIGLEERVSQAGGSFQAGPGPGGRGFQLYARVPTRAVQGAVS